jgi:glyoxylase-like metal-dependent hydrolase (beta-lactamase superfamily II)
MALGCEVLRLGPLDNRTYLLYCETTGEAALVDVGFEPEAAIERARFFGVTVRHLLATHAHYDHVAGMREVQRVLGGDFRMHPEDRPLLAALTQQGAMFGFPPAEAPELVHDLAHGDRIALGRESLEVLHLPGHAPGHVGFLWSGRTLWAGDVLFAGSVGRTDLPGGSWEQLERSIRERVFPLGDALRIHPGHGPSTTVGEERRHNPFVGEGAGRR